MDVTALVTVSSDSRFRQLPITESLVSWNLTDVLNGAIYLPMFLIFHQVVEFLQKGNFQGLTFCWSMWGKKSSLIQKMVLLYLKCNSKIRNFGKYIP